ncbi:MAG: IS66 family insertion sequence element accessory protein TnpA [Planctomycetota bacterium]
MARSSDPTKVAAWRGRFRRFARSGLAVARFCAKERVSVASFYYWRKNLGPEGRPQPVPECDDAFQQVTVVSAAVGVSIRLPGGAQIEVGSERLDTVRVVIAEVARADRDAESEHGLRSRSQAPAQKCGVASC